MSPTCPDAAQRGLRDGGLLHVRSMTPALITPSVTTMPGFQRVNPDLPRTELARKHTGDNVYSALCAAVDRAVRECDAAGDGADIDYAAAFAEALDRRPRGEQETEHIDVETSCETDLL